MPNIKALDLVVSDKKIFLCFPILVYVKHVTPGARQFLPQGHNLNKLGRVLADATYQISRLCALWFQTRIVFQYKTW